MRSPLRLGTTILLVLPLLAACTAGAGDPTASPVAEATPTASPTEVAAPPPTEVELASPEGEPTCSEVAPDATRIADLQIVVNNANTEPMVGWLAPTVNVVLAASSAYGPRTADQAGIDLSAFLNEDSSPAQYDFALQEATLDAYRAGDYAEYFPPTALVGRGSDNRVVAFSFDCDGLIDTMLLVSDENLLL